VESGAFRLFWEPNNDNTITTVHSKDKELQKYNYITNDVPALHPKTFSVASSVEFMPP